MSQFGLPDTTLEKMRAVFSVYPEIEKVIIYGSRAKGNYRPGSDIDLTLIAPSLNDAKLSQIKQQLDDLNTPYLMDISILSEITSTQLIEHIERCGQVFC